jgi:hypothetical protein
MPGTSGLLECSCRLNLSFNTLKRYDRATEPQRLQRVSKYRPTLADPRRDYLRRRRADEPGVPVAQLLREIRERGYQGSPQPIAPSRSGSPPDRTAAQPRQQDQPAAVTACPPLRGVNDARILALAQFP